VQHMREDTILSLETTDIIGPRTRTSPPGSGAGGKLHHPIWQKPSCGPQIGHSQSWASLWRRGRSCAVTSRGSPSSRNNLKSVAPALFALRESPVGRMAPSPLDITSGAVHPMDCAGAKWAHCSKQKRAVRAANTSTAIRRQNACARRGVWHFLAVGVKLVQ
jgi:hypothetical protein